MLKDKFECVQLAAWLNVSILSLRETARTIVSYSQSTTLEPIVLDFANIEMCSRSFADELLAGFNEIGKNPMIINANESVTLMLNMVRERQSLVFKPPMVRQEVFA